jgi:hypothetical protein
VLLLQAIASIRLLAKPSDLVPSRVAAQVVTDGGFIFVDLLERCEANKTQGTAG